MKRISNFKEFINEQEKKPKAGQGKEVNDVGDFMKDAAKIIKDAGFGDFTGEVNPDTGNTPGGGGNYKVPTAEDVKKGIEAVNAAMDRHGITDKNMRAAMQGVIGKESGWTPKNEQPYNTTGNDRIRKIFGKRVASLSDSELNALKADTNKFWDRVYGPDDITGASQKMGNTNPGDGGKYLGRGFNGITFKSGYEKMQELYNKNGKLGKSINFVSDPDALNDLDVAAEVAILYFVENLKSSKVKSLYGANDPNEFPDKDSALKAVFHVNSGLGTNLNSPIFQETLAKSTSFRDDMLAKNMV